MLTKVAVALLAITLSAGSVHARTPRSHSLSFAHFPTCSGGLVSAICVCRAQDASTRFGLCPSGQYCHTYTGACTQCFFIGALGRRGVTGCQSVNGTREDYNSRDRCHVSSVCRNNTGAGMCDPLGVRHAINDFVRLADDC